VSVAPAERTTITIGGESTVLGDRQDYELKQDRFDCARAVLNFMHLREQPVSIDVRTTIPIQAGLAGSTAILTAMVVALRRWLGLPVLEKHLLAETVRVIELHYLEIQCGYQDQYMTVFGGLNVMDFRDKEFYRDLKHEIFARVENLAGWSTCPSPSDDGPSAQPACDSLNNLPMILAHTGHQRVSGRVLRPIRERWEQGDRDVREGYRRIAELARLGVRPLIERDWETVARYMNENHRIQQSLGASGEINDRMIAVAMANGALAAKLAGAGGGGTILALSLEPQRTGAALVAAGASRILRPQPSPGVRLEI
jgi:galactokinase/mevalonate kinase-like predicted kinase